MGTMQRYYTPYEVAMHSSPTDCWVSFLGGVYDLTKLIKENAGSQIAPILEAAGTDISHWFDPATGDVRTQVDPVTNIGTPYCPQGHFLHVAPVAPTTTWDCSMQVPWWRDATYRIGSLSQRVRLIRIKSVLTEQEDLLEAPQEETIGEIRRRYLVINAHAGSYTWKALKIPPAYKAESGKPQTAASAVFEELDLNRTLEDNGVVDESADFEDVGLPGDYYVPVLHVYWQDDLTVA